MQLKGPENIYNKITEGNYPNLKKEIAIKIYKIQETGTEKKVSLSHNKYTESRRNIKAARDKDGVTY